MRAANFTWTSSDGQYTVTAENLDAGWHEIGYGNKYYEDTQILKVNKAGALAAFVADTKNLSGNSLMGVGGNSSRQILQIQGPMNSSDFAAMNSTDVARWETFTTIDLAQVTVSTAADVQSMNMGNAETIILPNSFTKAEVNEAGAAFAEANSNFGSCISLESETTPQVTTHYYYTPEGQSERIEIQESDVTNDDGTLTYTYSVDRTGTSSVSSAEEKYWYTYNNQNVEITETEYVNSRQTDQWGSVSYKITVTNADVTVTKETKYCNENGEFITDTWNVHPNANGEMIYGGTQAGWDPVIGNYFEGGTPVVSKDVYIYTDPSDNQSHTFATANVGDPLPTGINDDGNGNYSANVTLTNPQQCDANCELTYSYQDQNGETATISSNNYSDKKNIGDPITYIYSEDLTATVSTETTSADVTSTSVTAYVNTAGTLYKATELAFMYEGLVASNIETVVVSGNVTLDDITQTSNGADPIPNVTAGDGEPYEGEGTFTKTDVHPAFYLGNVGAPIKDLDLSSATIDKSVYLRTVSNNSALERIVFPDNLTRIPYACCYANGTSGNYKLKDIVFPQGLTSIGAYAFHGVAIKELFVTNKTTTIGWEAFGSCQQLEDLVFQAGLTDLSYSGYVFDSCTGLKHVIFPEGVTNIGNYIFNMCTSMESIHLPSSLRTIGDGAFHECHSIRTLVIPENVQSIGKSAFALCYIEDLFLMAEDVEHLPSIYSAGSDYSYSTSSFALNQLEGNNTSPQEYYDTYLTYTSDQMLELYRNIGHGGGNTITYIHFSPNVKAFIDANPFSNNPDYQKNDSEKEFLSDTYVFVDKEGNKWPSANSNHYGSSGRLDVRGNGEYNGDYPRCAYLGDPTNYQSTDPSAWNYSPYATSSLDEPSKLAWRQFVLRRGDAHDETVVIYKEYKDVWYTFCTPFDMTDEMLDVAFNENFNICEFDAVEVKDESIILHFNTIATSVYKDQNEVVYEDLGKDETDFHTFRLNGDTYTHVEVSAMPNTPTYAKDGNVENGVKVIEGFLALAYHPYMIHPNIGSMDPKRKAITGEYKDLKQIDNNTTLCSKTEFNTLSHAVKQTATYNGVSGDFYFIGNVDQATELVEAGKTRTVFSGDITPGNMVKTITGGENVTLGNKLIPQYAYFLGTAAGDTYPKYWKETAPNTRTSGGIWNTYSAIIISDQKIEKALGRTTNLQDNPIKSLEIDFSAFNPDEITAIEQIVEEARENNEPVQYLNIVYDFNGNIVKKGDTSLENLPGGMYIVNGKKYLVK
jgi:hypothetical protein